jgi:outer membrane protein TolC
MAVLFCGFDRRPARGRCAGTRTVVKVLDAARQLYPARRGLAQARYAAILARLQLSAAAARLAVAIDALPRADGRKVER